MQTQFTSSDAPLFTIAYDAESRDFRIDFAGGAPSIWRKTYLAAEEAGRDATESALKTTLILRAVEREYSATESAAWLAERMGAAQRVVGGGR